MMNKRAFLLQYLDPHGTPHSLRVTIESSSRDLDELRTAGILSGTLLPPGSELLIAGVAEEIFRSIVVP